MVDATLVIIALIIVAVSVLYYIYFTKKPAVVEVQKEEIKPKDTKKKVEERKEPKEKVKVDRDLQHDDLLGTLKGGKDSPKVGSIVSLAASSRFVAQVRDSDPYIRLWRVDTLQVADKKQNTFQLGTQSEYATCVALSSVGDLIACGTYYGNSIKLFYIPQPSENSHKFTIEVTKTAFEVHKKPVTQLEFSSNGLFLVSFSHGEDNIFIYTASKVESKLVQKIALGQLQVFGFSISDKYLATAAFTSDLKTFEVFGFGGSSQKSKDSHATTSSGFSYKKNLELKGHKSSLNSVSLSEDEKIVSAGIDGTLKIFSVKVKPSTDVNIKDSDYLLLDKKVELILPSATQFTKVLYCNKSTIVALGNNTESIVFVDGKNVHVKKTIEKPTINDMKLNCWAVSHDGKVLFTGGDDNVVRMWKVPEK